MGQLPAPFDQTAHLCGMRFLAPHVIHSANQFSGGDAIRPLAERYARLLAALRDGTLAGPGAETAASINALVPD